MKRLIKASRYDSYEGWKPADIHLHQSIDWASRDYDEYPVPEDSFRGTAILYSDHGQLTQPCKFIKYIRPNSIYPPYYAPEDKYDPFVGESGYVGPMADGRKHDGYQIHDRYESQDIYDALTR